MPVEVCSLLFVAHVSSMYIQQLGNILSAMAGFQMELESTSPMSIYVWEDGMMSNDIFSLQNASGTS